ncbi:hypothetical protein ABRY74_23100 [Pseudomonas guariconensis]|uniref:hypothetical protein n=1 Tax=Pseudomonas guariconensis TaxID=1288410 RepID=UPI003EDF9E04
MPASYRQPRYLTEQQLKNPLLRAAYQRLGNMVKNRGTYLRELDRVNGDRRTRIEKFVALERVAEQLLVRLDLATSTLGYLDDSCGRYVLNTQRHIAEDSEGVSEAVLSRLLGTLEEAGYVKRRIEKIRLDEKDQTGLHLVRTRVLVQFTMKFWADLGLRYVFSRVQHTAMKKRQMQLKAIVQRRQSELERHSLEQRRRLQSRARWQEKEDRMRKAAGQSEAQAAVAPVAPVAPPQRANATVPVAGAGLQGAMEKLQRSIANKRSNSA